MRTYLGDNYFFLPPKESRRVRITLSGSEGQPRPSVPPEVQIEAWNARRTEVRNTQ